MSPRRPVPARPGARPPGRGQRSARQAARPQAARTRVSEEAGATTDAQEAPASPGVPRDAEPSAPRVTERGQYTVVRLGAPDGHTMTVPARAIVLALVLLGAFVVVFPALRGFLAQQAQYDALTHQLAEARATSTALEQELAKWDDDDYVRSQARERLYYVMPGETTYVVVGADKLEERTSQQEAAAQAQSRPWYERLAESAEVAGASGQREPEANQQGWSTAIPTVPTAPASSAPSPTPTASASSSPAR